MTSKDAMPHVSRSRIKLRDCKWSLPVSGEENGVHVKYSAGTASAGSVALFDERIRERGLDRKSIAI